MLLRRVCAGPRMLLLLLWLAGNRPLVLLLLLGRCCRVLEGRQCQLWLGDDACPAQLLDAGPQDLIPARGQHGGWEQ